MVSVVGILNVTPDSFYDGGRFNKKDTAIKQVYGMIEDGVDIIDIGCESTRPESKPLSVEEELSRLKAVLPAIRKVTDKPISIDTYKPEIMNYAIAEGVDMINDIFALRAEGALSVIANSSVKICLMHLNDSIENMHDKPGYKHISQTVFDFLKKQAKLCIESGIEKERIVLDPGFGFSKTPEENFQLLREISMMCESDFPIYVGMSRKRFIGTISQNDGPDCRLAGSLAAAVWACQQGVSFIRTHDVRETVEALRFIQIMEKG